MPRASNKQKARQSNLQKARQVRNPMVEEVPDEEPDVRAASEDIYAENCPCPAHSHPAGDDDNSWEDFDLGNEFPDLDCDDMLAGPQEPDLDEEVVMAPEISDEQELDEFSLFLFEAQAASQKAERAKDQQRKRPKQYLGNTARTKRRHLEKKKQLKGKGFLDVFEYMAAKKDKKQTQHQNEPTDEVPSSSESDQSADSESDLPLPEPGPSNAVNFNKPEEVQDEVFTLIKLQLT
ncbi:hypothetical protein B0H13DRAFT_2539445 [Mycena leptocephala]|nr:hypothetical protein B0H13DRAFT_2539445 [Mycena leptocephala]